jgi:Lar family restriction alleviation protein
MSKSSKAQFPTPNALPCPFCGATEIHGSEHEGVFPYVICEKCGVSTGYAKNREDAVANWNQRVSG